jgi:hypothetical protein
MKIGTLDQRRGNGERDLGDSLRSLILSVNVPF